jgi:hypothetical protein
MSGNKVVILDGCGLPDLDLSPVLGELSEVFRRDGARIETFRLSEMKLAHCLGCFGCWVKTPGMCVENDAGRQIAKAVVQSDTTVFFTPVTFGGYSPDLKKMLDRFVQLASPYFQMDHGEVHHPPRYAHRPRLVLVDITGFREPTFLLDAHPVAPRLAVHRPKEQQFGLFKGVQNRCDVLRLAVGAIVGVAVCGWHSNEPFAMANESSQGYS